jgi:hypothetical protein
MDHDIEGLGRKIKELGEVLSPLSDGDWIEDWLKKVHGPGWTTIAEYTLVAGIVDNLKTQAEAFVALRDSVVRGSSQIAESVER